MAYNSKISSDLNSYNNDFDEDDAYQQQQHHDKQQSNQEDNSQEQQQGSKKKLAYKKIFENSKSWPSCFEKSLVKCLFYVQLQKKDLLDNYDTSEVDKTVDELVKECEFMRERLKVEGLDTNENEKFLDDLKFQFKTKNWQSAYKELESKYKTLKVLDIEKIRELIQEIDKAEAMLKDKDIILLLGGTGCGKSTTLHFLAGSKMRKVKRDGLNHIEPYENENDPTLINRIKTSPFPESETQCIAATEIIYQKIGIPKKGSIFLCDTPGFEDTNGAEVDIANGVGIVKVIQNCKSVRPVILISGVEYEFRRMNGMRNLTSILVGMVSDVQACISSFGFLLVNFFQEQKSDFKEKLNSLVKSILDDENDDNNETFLLFFDQLQSKLETFGPMFIDPLDGDRIKMIRYLDAIIPITRPDEVFRFSISPASNSAVKEQIRINQMMIISSAKNKDFKFVDFKLKQIKYLKDLLSQDYINSVYQECVQLVKHAINDQYKSNINHFKNAIKSEKNLDEETIGEYKANIERGKLLDEIKKYYEIKEIPSSETLLQNLKQQTKDLLDETETLELNDVNLKRCLDKIKILSEHFSNIEYNTTCVEEKARKLVEAFKETVNLEDYKQAAKKLDIIKSAVLLLAEHTKSLNTYQLEMKKFLIEHLKKFLSYTENIFTKASLDNSDTEKLSNLLLSLELAKDTFRGTEDLLETITNFYDQFLKSIVKQFDGLNKKVTSSYKQDLVGVEPFFKQISMISNIQTVNYVTAQSYYSTLEMICGYVENIKSEIEKIMTPDLIQSNKLDKLFDLVNKLEGAKWIDEYKQGTQKDVVNDIKVIINEQLKELIHFIKNYNLELENYSNLPIVASSIEIIFRLKVFEKFIIDFNTAVNGTQEWFQRNVERVLFYIQDTFHLNAQQISQNFLQLCHINTADNAFKYLSSCKDIRFLDNTGCLDMLKKLENRTKEHSDLVGKEIDELIFSVRSYNGNNREKLFSECQHLYNRTKELYEIEKFSEIKKTFNYNINLFDKVKQKILKYLNDFNEDIGRLNATKAITAADSKLDIARGLREMDEFYEDEPVSSVYKGLFRFVLENAPKILTDVTVAINKKDFATLLRLLLELSRSEDDVFKHYFVEAKNILNMEINRWIDDTKVKSKFFAHSMNDDKTFNDIVKNLESIEKVKILNKFIDNVEALDKFKALVKRNLTDAFIESLIIVENLIKSFKLTNVHSIMRSIRMQIDMLDPFYIDEILPKYDETKSKFTTELDSLRSKYESRKIDDYLIHPPKKDFERLESVDSSLFSNVSVGNNNGNNILEDLRQLIINKFNVELQNAHKKESPRERDQAIKKLKYILNTLPENLKYVIEQDIERLNEDIIEREKETKSSFESAIETKDLKYLEAHIEEYKSAGSKSEYWTKINDFINKEVKEYSDKIRAQIDKNDLFQALKLFEPLSPLKTFSHRYLQSKHVNEYKIMCSKLKKKIDGVVSNLNDFFKCFADIEMSRLVQDEELADINHSLDLLENIYSFRKNAENILEEILPNFQQVYMKIAKTITDHTANIQNKFKEAIGSSNMSAVKSILDNVRCWERIVKIKQFLESIPKDNVNSRVIEQIKYQNLLKQTEQKIKELKSFFDEVSFINEATTKYEYERTKFYADINSRVQIAREVCMLNDHPLNYPNLKNFESEIAEILKAKRDDVLNSLIEIASKPKLTSEDCQIFNKYHSNMICLAKSVNIGNISDPLVLKNVESKLFETIDQIKSSIENNDIKDAADNLIIMKTISDNLTMFKKQIDEKIDAALKAFKKKRGKEGGITISKLGGILDVDTIGKIIISEHTIFEGFALAIFNDKVQKHNIDYVLDSLTGDTISMGKLKRRFDEFERHYKKLVKDNLNPKLDLKEFIAKINFNFKKAAVTVWDSTVTQKLPELVAHLFALWTLSNSKHYFENEGIENQSSYLLQPHPAQVIAIFRLLGVGDDKEILNNSFCEIGTGEGKSVTLAVTACVFTMFGYQVSCACYSEYLSQRDYNAFLPMFQLLNVDSLITYGTFNKICENILNYDGDVREKVLNFVSNNDQKKIERKTSRKQILLIDEVDVFLNKDFYGNIYRPFAVLKNSIKPLVDLVWTRRGEQLSFNLIKNAKEYTDCCEKYGEWAFLIEEAVKTMISDVKRFNTPAYVVENDKIGYVELDGISFNTVYGYKTLFAYYYENQNGNISNDSLNENVYIQIKCGNYSYAEIPHQFQYIMGVTGTLKTLSIPEREIVEKAYKIKKKTYTPSVFGKNNLRFVEQNDVFIETSDDYHKRILREIECRLEGKNEGTQRAVLVFFESRKELLQFYNSDTFLNMEENARILTEEDNLTLLEKDRFIKDATRSGAISLITRSFGRGTDFVCRDDIVLANGGVHVLQTFLSEQLSEEIQIKGRTARQGDLGSYSMVLLDKSLEKFSITLEDIQKNQANVYKFINEKRNAYFESQYSSNKDFIDFARTEHENSLNFLKYLAEGKPENVKNFLKEKNKCPHKSAIQSRTIVLMDATGSMNQLLTKAKNTVGKMFERANEILEEHKMAKDCFQLQFACYRDYDCGINGILQASSWETKPDNLRMFMDTVKAYGGGDIPEAIEIGLWHANQENKKEKVSQIILIGDAPAKDMKKIIEYRNIFGGDKLWEKSFGPPTYYLDELQKLNYNNIFVFPFYLHLKAKTNFEEIARTSGTIKECEYLNIDSNESSESLINLVTFHILSNIGKNCGKGNDLADAYMKKFSKGHKKFF